MTTMTRKQVVAYYKKAKLELPAIVAKAKPKTKFAFGFMSTGLCRGFAPLHRTGQRVTRVYDMLSIDPMTDEECYAFVAGDKKAARKR